MDHAEENCRKCGFELDGEYKCVVCPLLEALRALKKAIDDKPNLIVHFNSKLSIAWYAAQDQLDIFERRRERLEAAWRRREEKN